MIIISRDEAGLKPPSKRGKMASKLDRIFAHWMGPAFPEQMDDYKIMQSVQRYHMGTKGWSDIAYSFTIGREINPADGKANKFEARGLNTFGAHTFTENNDSYGIAFLIGVGEKPTEAQWQAFTELVEYIRLNHGNTAIPAADIVVMGHTHDKQVDGKGTATSCPGPDLTPRVWEYNHARDFRPQDVAPNPEPAPAPMPPMPGSPTVEERLSLIELDIASLKVAVDDVLKQSGSEYTLDDMRDVFYTELRKLANE